MYNPKTGVRAIYRQQENERVKDSPTLAAKFPELKSLTVNLLYSDSASPRKGSELKYTVNLAHAKSVLRFNCINAECVCGDFDLSQELAGAIADREEIITGKMPCQGWQNKNTIDRLHCSNVLTFELLLDYHEASEPAPDLNVAETGLTA